jgi:uncharacterized protein (TIGR00369 family)
VATAEDAAPWREPVRGGYPDPELFGLPGVEQLRASVQGRSPKPPISRLLGTSLNEVGLGTAAFSMPATRWLLSPQGLISVGTLAMLADAPLGCAVQSALPARTPFSTSELSLRLLRPAGAGGTLVARGALVHAGRTLALSTVQIVDERGRLLAHGSSMCFVRLPGNEAAAMPAAERATDPPPLPRPHDPAPPPGSPDPYERPELGEVHPQEVWRRMSGLEVLEAQIAGDLPKPPISFLIGTRLVECGPGRAVFALPCHEWLCSPLRTVQGGTIAMVADAALAAAIQTTVPAGAALAAIDLKVNFVRPVKPDGRELLSHGRVRHGGRTIAIAEAEVVNADGKLVALATGSAMVLAGRQATLGDSD